MFDQVTIRVADRPASERFYRTTLATLGLEPDREDADAIGWDDLAVAAADAEHPPTHYLHIAFVAPSRANVDEFWRAGRAAGYEDAGAPGERPQYTPGYYGAFLRDPDGNSAEAVHHADVRRGGNIDHLWIRVRDLDAATARYAAIMRHTGLREGRRWPEGRQFRGAWATLSLVEDGAPVTENLQLAFPAPDSRTVEEFHREAAKAGFIAQSAPGATAPLHLGSYAAFALDPDGNSVGSVFREPG